jgi:hypothetical protein
MQAKNRQRKNKSDQSASVYPMKEVRSKFVPDFDIDKLIPYDKNPRINDPAVAEVVKSILKFGFRDPIEITEDFVIVAGHTRYKAANEIGISHVPVVIHKFKTVQEFIGYNIANNQTASIARWDMRLLGDKIEFLTEHKIECRPVTS